MEYYTIIAAEKKDCCKRNFTPVPYNFVLADFIILNKHKNLMYSTCTSGMAETETNSDLEGYNCKVFTSQG